MSYQSIIITETGSLTLFLCLFKELEHGLNEQRDLTKAIAIQGSRAQTQSQSADEHAGYLNTHPYLYKYMPRLCHYITLHYVCSLSPANEDKIQEVELAVHRKWTHLCNRLTKTAETEQGGDKDQDPSEV